MGLSTREAGAERMGGGAAACTRPVPVFCGEVGALRTKCVGFPFVGSPPAGTAALPCAWALECFMRELLKWRPDEGGRCPAANP